MQKTLFVFSARVRILVRATLLAVAYLPAHPQYPPAGPALPAAPLHQADAAGLSDTLLSRATALYYSTAKNGLRSFDCQVHPDWKLIISSSRQDPSVPADDPRLALVSGVKITLHERLKGDSSIDWQVPAPAAKPLDQAAMDLLDRAHRGIENTLLGVLRLWIPMVDGSLVESLGEDGAAIAETASGYTLRTKEKQHSLTEEFDRNLVLRQYTAADSGSGVRLDPTFEQTGQGLLMSSFVAHIQPAGPPAQNAQEMRVGLAYESISGAQLPSRITVEMPGVVQMDFNLDGCTVNPQ
jgi:hypothetical protein